MSMAPTKVADGWSVNADRGIAKPGNVWTLGFSTWGDSFEGKHQRYNLITRLSGETEAAVGSAGQERSLIPKWKGSVSRRRRKTVPHGLTDAGETEDAVVVPWGHAEEATAQHNKAGSCPGLHQQHGVPVHSGFPACR
ncbi:unnamed protein product [Rangifer tarandus platyrhynchus]|uniref:Uncharacterized protein n=1 Tax=Rangifer tarandus platyrhynchus TaxID=3082113 RepID=A0ABN8ZI80_RANTA|nr:unnamed protein product [Rangifer tarandus platyrhynchus]